MSADRFEQDRIRDEIKQKQMNAEIEATRKMCESTLHSLKTAQDNVAEAQQHINHTQNRINTFTETFKEAMNEMLEGFLSGGPKSLLDGMPTVLTAAPPSSHPSQHHLITNDNKNGDKQGEEARMLENHPTKSTGNIDGHNGGEEYIGWHGYLGNQKWKNPKTTFITDEFARKGYTNIDASEYEDDREVLSEKVDLLVHLIQDNASGFVAYTGAGISTAAGIADYASKNKQQKDEDEAETKEEERTKTTPDDGLIKKNIKNCCVADTAKQRAATTNNGVTGDDNVKVNSLKKKRTTPPPQPATSSINTKTQQNQKISSSNPTPSSRDVFFQKVLHLKPTLAHRVLTALEKQGYVQFWLQQNHDGLAQKAGFPQTKLCEIHGSWWDTLCNPVVPMSGQLRPDLVRWMRSWKAKARFVLALGTSFSGMAADQVAAAAAKRAILAHNKEIMEGVNNKEYRNGNNFGDKNPLPTPATLVVCGNTKSKEEDDEQRESNRKNEITTATAASMGGLCIVALQRTPLDNAAALRMFAKADVVMKLLMQKMNLTLDPKVDYPMTLRFKYIPPDTGMDIPDTREMMRCRQPIATQCRGKHDLVKMNNHSDHHHHHHSDDGNNNTKNKKNDVVVSVNHSSSSSSSYWICDGCGKKFRKSDDDEEGKMSGMDLMTRFRCEECDFDLCERCRDYR